MRLIWHQRPHLERKLELAEAFREGLQGKHEFEIIHGFNVVCGDALVLFGIGGIAKTVYDAYKAAGKKIVFLDKGYSRRTGHWRVSINSFQPLEYFQLNRPADRFNRLGIELQPYKGGTHILFDGASNKYCLWQGLGDQTEWGAAVVQKIAENTDLPIIYRPRPSHNEPVAVPGAELSTGPLEDDLARARVVVSYGGNIGWDAVIAGVPHFAIGDSIARPVSETNWKYVGKGWLPGQCGREQWCRDVAYCQFTLDEFRSGEAWAHIETFL